jgi:hypothetical protein
MTTALYEFKRMVVRLPHSVTDYEGVGVAAKLAEQLQVDLVATFIEDTSLIEMAGLPFARELRALGEGWRALDVTLLLQEFERAASAARRRFEEITRSCRIETSFDVVRGPAADIIGTLVRQEGIVVIIEPRNPAERVTTQFTRLTNAAFNVAAAVMIVPSRIARTTGDIIAIATMPDDPSIRAALAIASATGERLRILSPVADLASDPEITRLVQATGVQIEAMEIPKDTFNLPAFVTGQLPANERLIVMMRGADSLIPLSIASSRGVPVLVINTPDLAANAEPSS